MRAWGQVSRVLGGLVLLMAALALAGWIFDIDFLRSTLRGLPPIKVDAASGLICASTARPTGGETSNGLGLSIVKKFAEAMSGAVECVSELGSGATFIVRLPAWDRSEQTASSPGAAETARAK